MPPRARIQMLSSESDEPDSPEEASDVEEEEYG